MSRFKSRPFAHNNNARGNNVDGNDSNNNNSSLRLSNALNRARKEASLNLSNLNLSRLPDDVFDLRKGLLDGDGGMKAWEIFGEEAQVSFD